MALCLSRGAAGRSQVYNTSILLLSYSFLIIALRLHFVNLKDPSDMARKSLARVFYDLCVFLSFLKESEWTKPLSSRLSKTQWRDEL
jgi:hypothetical protein